MANHTCVGPRAPHPAWSVAIWITLAAQCIPTRAADEPEMRFRFADGSEMVGRLDTANVDEQIQVHSHAFAQPMQVSTDDLLEGRIMRPPVIAPDQPTETSSRFAFLLADGSQLVGTVSDRLKPAIGIQTQHLGRLTIQDDSIVRIVQQSEMPDQILSLANSRFRFRHETGWSFNDEGLRCTEPEAATVANYELPSRFRLRLKVICDGDADFELSLGDRSVIGAGQGSGRVDRRGGSLSRLPTERLVTRLEWVDHSVSIVRSNASVSSAEVFDPDARNGRLEIDLYCDQTDGRLIATSNGLMMANVKLADETPELRSVLTLISRRDAVVVTGLDLFHWNGIEPTSRRLPDRFTMLRDGTLINDVADDWEPNRFHLREKWHAFDELSRMELSGNLVTATACELTLTDGTRLRGRIDQAPQQSDGQVEQGESSTLIINGDAVAETVAVDPKTVTRIIGRANDVGPVDAASDQFIATGIRLQGRLVDGRDWGATFGWRPDVGNDVMGIVAEQNAEVQMGRTNSRSVDRVDSEPVCFLELLSGDRLPGEFVSFANEGVHFRSDLAGQVIVASADIGRVRLQRGVKPDPSESQMLLSLPRQMQDSPPTHLLVSTNGDALRGRLLSIDSQEARIEVRGRTRIVEQDRISEIIWLDQKMPITNDCRYVVTTAGGGQLGLQSAEFDGMQLRGTHSILGDCQIQSGDLTLLRFGNRPNVP
ncbi:MAG: hypothetical protein KDB00_28210, partial [Planctomycetales bacterium]|nr:hypothetical protein [Planctomycetales bacterium]